MNKAELFHQLHQTTRIFLKGLNKRLDPYGISSSEWAIIWNLNEHGPMTQASLASFLSIEPPAISNSLSRLERKKLIKRKSGQDKRERTVFLSEKALSQFSQWEEVADNYRNTILCCFPKEKQDELFELLNIVYLTIQQLEK